MKYGLLGKKIGMTRVYDEKGRIIPVSVVAVGGNTLLQVKTVEKDGYSAIQVGFDTQKESRMSNRTDSWVNSGSLPLIKWKVT